MKPKAKRACWKQNLLNLNNSPSVDLVGSALNRPATSLENFGSTSLRIMGNQDGQVEIVNSPASITNTLN